MQNTFIGNRNLVYNKRKTKHILSKNINAYDSNDKRKTHFPPLMCLPCKLCLNNFLTNTKQTIHLTTAQKQVNNKQQKQLFNRTAKNTLQTTHPRNIHIHGHPLLHYAELPRQSCPFRLSSRSTSRDRAYFSHRFNRGLISLIIKPIVR